MASKRAIRVHLVENDRPVKMLLEREVVSGAPTVIAVHDQDLASEEIDSGIFDTISGFEIEGVGRVETQRRQTENGDSDYLRLDLESEIDPDATEVELSQLASVIGKDFGSRDDQFLTKPLSAADLGNIALELEARKGEGGRQSPEEPRQAPWASSRQAHRVLLGRSQAMMDLLAIVQRVAVGSASILIQGETGTGKTLVARQIHAASPRSDRRFVAINCSAFQDQLLESELFGHEKGSFTGAASAKPGLFEIADQGTLFLDEVGDMTAAMQAKLLQVLDDGELRRVGGTKTRRVDARILAASNKDLQQEVKVGRFREDLYFRLNVIHLQVPRLADRRDDIEILVDHFLERFRLPGQPIKRFTPEAMARLRHYDWPGNVRELTNTIEGLTLLAPGDEIREEDLPPGLRPSGRSVTEDSDEPLPLSEVERIYIQRALRYTEGKKAPAARLLGIDVKTLRSKIRLYEIDDSDL